MYGLVVPNHKFKTNKTLGVLYTASTNHTKRATRNLLF